MREVFLQSKLGHDVAGQARWRPPQLFEHVLTVRRTPPTHIIGKKVSGSDREDKADDEAHDLKASESVSLKVGTSNKQ